MRVGTVLTRGIRANVSRPLASPLLSGRPFSNTGKAIYLDAQSTTPCDPRVLDAMLPYQTNLYGNPHSKTHSYGWESEEAVEAARAEVVGFFAFRNGKKIIINFFLLLLFFRRI